MTAAITGIGWVTAAGMGCGRKSDSFSMPAGNLPKITGMAVFNKPSKQIGRMDEYSRLGLAAIAFALKDAGLEKWKKKRDIGIIASTVYGCLHTDIDFFNTVIPNGGLMASPNLFAY
ncbi:MAG: beta-ketoacyl synthase, partial [Deltaproteobacteria bacterium]|nr:beta-ketoacyl synthase [Deltaproteobacteria bacterium]